MTISDSIQKDQDIERNRLASEFQKQLSGSDNGEADEPFGFRSPGIVFGNTVPSSQNTTEYLKAAIGWVYSCVSAIADSIAGIEFELYSIKNGEITEVDEHPILDLLYHPNDFQTAHDHLYLSQTYLELAGESPWFVDRGKNGDSDPTGMMLIRPDKLSIVKSSQNSGSPIDGYTLDIGGGQKKDIKYSELVFLKYPDPNNMFRGKGTLQAAAATVDVDTYSEDFNKRFFFNSARPDSVLSTDQKLTPVQREALRNDIKRLYKGNENAHKTALLESGLKWSPMAISQKDMDFLEQQRYSMSKILSIFRVPKTIVAITDDVNRANAETAEYVFAKRTIKPKLLRIVAQLNEFLLPMFKGTETMFLSFEDPVPADVTLNIARYDSALTKGYMTINEVRNEIGLDPIGTEGDVIYVPMNLVPVGTPPQQPILPQDQQSRAVSIVRSDSRRMKRLIANSAGGYAKAAKSKKISSVTLAKQKAFENVDRKIDEMANAFAKQLVKKQWEQKIAEKVEDHESDLALQHHLFEQDFIKTVGGFQKLFAKITAEQFEREKNAILKKMPKKAVYTDKWLLDEEDESQIMVEAYTPDMKKLIAEQGKRAAALIAGDATFDITTQIVRDYIKNRTFKFSFDMTEETNNLLKAQFDESIKLGESIQQMRVRVRELFDGMKTYRAERISRSEVIRASNFAATEAYQQSGVVDYVEWLTSSSPCEFCAPLSGKQIAVGETFFNNGDTVVGADGSQYHIDYQDVEYPPLHPNCECTVVPVVSKSFEAPVRRTIEAMKQQKEQLALREAELKQKEAEFDAKMQKIADRENQLIEREKQGEISKEQLEEAKLKLTNLRNEIIKSLNE